MGFEKDSWGFSGVKVELNNGTKSKNMGYFFPGQKVSIIIPLKNNKIRI